MLKDLKGLFTWQGLLTSCTWSWLIAAGSFFRIWFTALTGAAVTLSLRMWRQWSTCSGTIREPAWLKKLLEHWSPCPQWSRFYITMDWKDQERSSRTIKLDWNLQPVHRMRQMSSGANFNGQTRQSLNCFDTNTRSLFGRLKVRLSDPRTLNKLPNMVVGASCCGAEEHGIMMEED